MELQLNRRCLEVLHAETFEDYLRMNVEFVRAVGGHTFAATVITEHSPALTEFQSVTNAPLGYLPTFEDMESAKRDPVSQHCKRSFTPIVWDQDVYVSQGRGDFWEHQSAFGYRSGICVAFHLPRGMHFMFGMDSDRRTLASKKDLHRLESDLHVFAAHSQAAAFDLCLPYQRNAELCKIPPGELDALRRSMDGLSNWEVGQAMGISETEVLLRIRRAMHFLGCHNKYEAALRAIKLGLVDCE